MDLRRLEKKLASLQKTRAEKATQIEEIWDRESKEDRDLNEDERNEVLELTKNMETLKAEEGEVQKNIDLAKEVHETSKNLGSGPQFSDFDRVQVQQPSESETKSLGEEFLEQKGYKDLMEKGFRGDGWQHLASFDMTLPELQQKAVLYSTPGSVVSPKEYQPGIVQTLFQRNYVQDLLGAATTTAPQITYVSETTATNAAAAVAEGQAKPQSTLAFGETTEPVRKLAHILPVSEEMLADAPQIQAYVNSRLGLFLQNTEEAQLLLGSGVAPNIMGIIAASGRQSVGTYARGTVDDNALALFKAMNGTRGSSQLDPDAIVIHPTNWQAIRTAKDVSGQYYGGGPFYGPYGGPQGPAGSSQFSVDNLWGVRVVVTSNITIGSALVGNFGVGGAVYRRQGITVDATNSHSTWFADNITALRAEERLALAVYRQSAFTVVTGLN